MKRIRRASSAILVASLCSLVAPVSPVRAAIGVSVDKTSALVDGDTVSITLSGIPTGQGVYIRQCYKPTIGQRDSNGLKCNGSLQRTNEMIWASTVPGFLRQGALNVGAPIPFGLRSRVIVYEADGLSIKESLPCGISDCAIFVHRDHLGLQDTSLDVIVPLTFLGTQTIKARKIGLLQDGETVQVGKALTLRNSYLFTDQKSRVRVLSDTAGICSVSRGASTTTIRFYKKGSCAIELVAKATATHLRFSSVLTYKVS